MAIRRTLSLAALALAGSFLASLPASAYIIILKDGTRIEAAAKPVGNRVSANIKPKRKVAALFKAP